MKKIPQFFWISHPDLFVSKWMRPDYYNLDNVDFVAKYFNELLMRSNDKQKHYIADVLKNVWSEISNDDRVLVINVFCENKNKIQSTIALIEITEYMGCDFLKAFCGMAFWRVTGESWNESLKEIAL